jgi:Flp pilus assembly pilin Flp
VHTAPDETPPMTSKLDSARPSALNARARARAARFVPDVRGAVFVEYVALVALVGLVLTLLLVTLGPDVVREYSARRAALYSHSP